MQGGGEKKKKKISRAGKGRNFKIERETRQLHGAKERSQYLAPCTRLPSTVLSGPPAAISRCGVCDGKPEVDMRGGDERA